MSKRSILILALAFVVGISAYAYAEVQNIKVGGDLTMMGLSRYGFNLTTPEADASGLVAITRLRLDADLTDEVMVTVRLLNERVWGTLDMDLMTSDDIDLDLAYVTLREFLYSPLTLTVGRQDFRLGSGLIVGDPDTNQYDMSLSGLPMILGDLSSSKAFDGIVGVLDYAPLTLTLGYLKINETPGGNLFDLTTDGLRAVGDDVDAYVVNAAYDFGDERGTMGELYYVLADVGDDSTNTVANMQTNDISNIGMRLMSSPLENLSASAELAYQTSRRLVGTGHRSDTALILAANYALPEVDWSPILGFDYIRIGDNWNPMFEDVASADIANALFPATNCQIFGLTAIAYPMEDVSARVRFASHRLANEIPGLANSWATYAMNSDKKSLGNEWDLHLMYDYTEDVQLGFKFGYFDTGKAFMNREDATQVIGSMKVTF